MKTRTEKKTINKFYLELEDDAGTAIELEEVEGKPGIELCVRNMRDEYYAGSLPTEEVKKLLVWLTNLKDEGMRPKEMKTKRSK